MSLRNIGKQTKYMQNGVHKHILFHTLLIKTKKYPFLETHQTQL